MLKETILNTAVTLARKSGFRSLTRHSIAKAAGCAVGTVNYHFQAMDLLRVAVIDFAIEHEVVEILAQARAERHPRLNGRLTPALKARVADHITGK